jgi:SulP family sulfate permease
LAKFPRVCRHFTYQGFPGATFVFDLTVAVEVGMILAAFLFIRRISKMTMVSLVDEATDVEGDHHSLRGKTVPSEVLVFSVFGALMFGAAEKLENLLVHSRQEPRVLILRMQRVLAMDATALRTLENLYEKLCKRGIALILSGPHTQPYAMMAASGFLDHLGHDRIAGDIGDALEKAKSILDRSGLQREIAAHDS